MVYSFPWVSSLLNLGHLSQGLLHECVIEGLISHLLTFKCLFMANWNRLCNTRIVVVTCSDSRDHWLIIRQTILLSTVLHTVVDLAQVSLWLSVKRCLKPVSSFFFVLDHIVNCAIKQAWTLFFSRGISTSRPLFSRSISLATHALGKVLPRQWLFQKMLVVNTVLIQL